MNAALISGLNEPFGIAVDGSDLFVTNVGAGTIGEYTTAGATVNAALITGLIDPLGVAVDGSDLFVTNAGAGTIGEYTTAGTTVNAALITGLNGPFGLAIPSAVPEASTWWMLLLGFSGLGIGAYRRRSRQHAASPA